MGTPVIQALQDVSSLIQILGTGTVVILAWKISRYLGKREVIIDNKLDAILAQGALTQSNHIEHVQKAVDQQAQQMRENHLEVLRELRDSNSKIIDSARDNGDRIVQAVLTLKH